MFFFLNKFHVPNHQAVSLSFNGQTTNQSQFDGSSCFHIKKRSHPRIGAVQVAYAVVDFNEDLSTSLDPRFYPANYIHLIHAFTVNQQELPIIQGIVWIWKHVHPILRSFIIQSTLYTWLCRIIMDHRSPSMFMACYRFNHAILINLGWGGSGHSFCTFCTPKTSDVNAMSWNWLG